MWRSAVVEQVENARIQAEAEAAEAARKAEEARAAQAAQAAAARLAQEAAQRDAEAREASRAASTARRPSTTATTAQVVSAGDGSCTLPSNCPAMRVCENGGSYGRGKSYPTYFGAYQFAPKTWAYAAPNAKGGEFGSATAEQQDAAADWLYAHSNPAKQWPICHKHLARYRR